MADRPKSREELHKELAELWAASKHLPASISKEQLQSQQVQQHQQHQQQQLPPAHQDAGQSKLDSTRKGTGQRKASSERSSSEGLKESKCSDIGGSQDSAVGLWSTNAVPKCDQQHHSLCDSESTPCLRWLPFKAVTSILRKHPSIWITTLLLFLVLSTGGVLGVVFIAASETQQRKLSAEGFAINAAVAFERQLAQMFFPLLSLATIVRFDPYYPRFNASFDNVAKELMEQMPTQGAVTNLIAAPQGVLRNFYPLSGYCQDKCNDININLFTNPERREVALKTVKEGRLIMQGPMMLSQGYFGVVGRQPVYIVNATANETFGAPDGLAHNCSVCWNATTKTQFWGFVNAVINLQSLVNGQDSRLRDLRVMGYLYEMFKFEKNGSRTEIARSHTPPTDPVLTDVHVPGGVWYLQVSPEQGWVPIWRAPILAVVVLVCCLFALLLGAILVSNRLQAYLKTANDALALEKERMDVLLARQHNLISCVLQGEGAGGAPGRQNSMQHRTLARIEDMRREIGVAQHTNGTTNGADELQLIELVDEGTYGKVFKGLWRGSNVAVKTMVLPAKMSGAEKRERMAVMEAAISSAMCHPNIVQTFTYIIKPSTTSVAQCPSEGDDCSLSQASAGEAVPSGSVAMDGPPEATVHNFEVSLVLEYCDWGSLRTALDAGAFFADDNSLNFAAILDTAADVARAMLHLHKNQVLHSDLKVRNVLLKSDATGRGCIAKVADFGLAVKMDCMETHVSAFQGTMSHMSPEALLHGHISKAADVYAFGITLWELFTGGQAYQGIPRALVGHKVAVLGLRPTLPPFTPPDYRALVEDCWHQDPEQRPTFDVVLTRLLKMRADLGVTNTPPLQRYELQRKVSQEGRNSSEKGVDGAAADAQAQGLIHLGSFYINCSSSSAQPMVHSADASNTLNGGSMHSSGAGGSFGSGGSGHSSSRKHGVLSSGSGSGGYSGYRPAPRTPYMASKLYAMTGSKLGPIPDTEEADEDPCNPLPSRTTPLSKQQKRQQDKASHQPQHVQHVVQDAHSSLAAAPTTPAAMKAAAAVAAAARASLCNGCSKSSMSGGAPQDAAAKADAWAVTMPLEQGQQGAAAAREEEAEQMVQEQQVLLMQRCRCSADSGSSSCRTSSDTQQQQKQPLQPDIELGKC